MEKTIKTADEINSETVLALEKKYGKQAVEEIDRVLRECHERRAKEKQPVRKIVDSMQF